MLDNNKSGGKSIDTFMYFTSPPDFFQRIKFSLTSRKNSLNVQ